MEDDRDAEELVEDSEDKVSTVSENEVDADTSEAEEDSVLEFPLTAEITIGATDSFGANESMANFIQYGGYGGEPNAFIGKTIIEQPLLEDAFSTMEVDNA